MSILSNLGNYKNVNYASKLTRAISVISALRVVTLGGPLTYRACSFQRWGSSRALEWGNVFTTNFLLERYALTVETTTLM